MLVLAAWELLALGSNTAFNPLFVTLALLGPRLVANLLAAGSTVQLEFEMLALHPLLGKVT